MRNSLTAAGRILTLFSLVFLVALSFTIVFVDSQATKQTPHALYKRAATESGSTPTHTTPTPSPSPSQAASSVTPSISSPNTSPTSTPTPTPTPTPSSASVSEKPTSTSDTSVSPSSTPSDASSPSSTSTEATSTTSQLSSDSSAATSPSVVASSSPIPSSNTPSASSGTSRTLTSTLITKGTSSQPTVMRTGTASSLPTSTVSASATPVLAASSSGFWANKGAVAATFTVLALIGLVALVFGYNFMVRRRRRARYREELEAYYEKSAAPPQGGPGEGGLGDSGLEEAEASMANVMTPASPDAYPDRQIHFGATDSPVMYTPQIYGIEYPPGTKYHQAVAAADYQLSDGTQDYNGPGPSGASSQFTSGYPDAHAHNGGSANFMPTSKGSPYVV